MIISLGPNRICIDSTSTTKSPHPTGGQTTEIRLGWTQVSTECLSYLLGEVPGLFTSDAYLWFVT